ncbi:MAG TPA: alpha/beta fold hydrolase [Acidimicrobiia bacterium]|nr:alpha/beta fold hydrolase [Acidimicrobiia bacterium]
MAVVLVHGVPDTADLWAPLVERLERDDVVCPSLPGFGTPVPAGFGCTKDEYATWLVQELRGFDEPVDVVGHDWGSLLVQRVATTNPELLRSWVLADGAVSEVFRWHDLAEQWQTAGVGEQIMELMVGDVVVDALREGGHPNAAAAVTHIDDRMKAAVLALYRSAVHVAGEWTPGPVAGQRPALVLWGERDPYGPPEYGRAAAAQAGAEFITLDAGHWSLVERPDDAAAALARFWAAS